MNDYVIGEAETRDRIERLEVRDKMDSDHHPIEVMICRRGMKRERKSGKKKKRVGR